MLVSQSLICTWISNWFQAAEVRSAAHQKHVSHVHCHPDRCTLRSNLSNVHMNRLSKLKSKYRTNKRPN